MFLMSAAMVGAWCAAPALAQPAAEMEGPTASESGMKTVAVLGVKGYDELISDIEFLGGLAGQPGAGQMAEGGVALFTQGRGTASIDRAMPWGVIVQTDGFQFIPVACLPITKLDDLLQVVENYGAKVDEAGDGVKQISLPNGQMLYVKATGPWAFVGQTPNSLAQLPVDPQKTLSELVAEYDVAVSFSVQNIPEMYRQMALAAMAAGVQQGLANQQGTEAERESQRKLAEAQQRQIVKMIQEIDSLTLGWTVDSKEQRTYLDFVYHFLPDSDTAKLIAATPQPTTKLAGFHQPDAAFTATLTSKGDPELMKENVEQLKVMMSGARDQINQKIDEDHELSDDERQAVKDAIGKLLDAMEATFASGQIDGGVAVQAGPESLTVVAGMLAQRPEEVEEALKMLSEVAAKDPKFPGVQWNVANHAGVRFNAMSVPIPAGEAEARTLWGENLDVAVGIGPDAIYLAMGRDWQSAINQAIDASAAEPDKAVPLFEMSVSLESIMSTAAAVGKEGDRAKAQMMADMLKGEAQGRDHIRMVANFIPNGEQLRIEVEEGVLRAIGKLAAMAQQAQQQGMQEAPVPQ